MSFEKSIDQIIEKIVAEKTHKVEYKGISYAVELNKPINIFYSFLYELHLQNLSGIQIEKSFFMRLFESFGYNRADLEKAQASFKKNGGLETKKKGNRLRIMYIVMKPYQKFLLKNMKGTPLYR